MCCRVLAQGLVLNADTRRAPGSLGPVAELRDDEDDAYFSSYGHYGIHQEMLKVSHARAHTHAHQRKHTHTDGRAHTRRSVCSCICTHTQVCTHTPHGQHQ